jgi:hypothetical protein
VTNQIRSTCILKWRNLPVSRTNDWKLKHLELRRQLCLLLSVFEKWVSHPKDGTCVQGVWEQFWREYLHLTMSRGQKNCVMRSSWYYARIWNQYACAKMLLYEGSIQKCDASGKKLMCDDDRTVFHHWNEAAKSILILNSITIRSEVTPQLGSWPHFWPLPETQFQVRSVLCLKETQKTYEKIKGIREGQKFKTDHKEHILWRIYPLLSGDSVKRDRIWATAR